MVLGDRTQKGKKLDNPTSDGSYKELKGQTENTRWSVPIKSIIQQSQYC